MKRTKQKADNVKEMLEALAQVLNIEEARFGDGGPKLTDKDLLGAASIITFRIIAELNFDPFIFLDEARKHPNKYLKDAFDQVYLANKLRKNNKNDNDARWEN